MPEPDLQAAIKRIETSRQTHVDWRDYWLGIPDHADCSHCKATADIAGDLDRQVRVISEYDNVLAVLRDVSAAATRARAEGAAEALRPIQNLAMEHANCSGCPTPWWLTQELAKEAGRVDL